MKRPTRYRYVDFAAQAQPGFRNRVVSVDEVPGLVERYRAVECYASIFHFSDEILLYLAEHRVDGRPSIAGYDGKVSAPFLPLDIDAHPPAGALEDALALARRVYQQLIERWEASPEAVHVYFSGAKGFHLLIDTRVFGRVAASHDLHRIFSRVRLDLLRALPDAARPLFDLAIGDKVRLLRLPNTRHAGSGLYKVALSADELLTRSVAEIRELARAPRPLRGVSCAGLAPTEPVATSAQLRASFHHARQALRRERGVHPYQMGATPAHAGEALCAARLALWQTRIPPGNRNNAAIRLASAFRLAGYSRDETLALLQQWNRDNRVDLPDAEIRAVGQSAYARPFPYTYGCHDEVIRQFCPYVGRLNECVDYRQRHARSVHT